MFFCRVDSRYSGSALRDASQSSQVCGQTAWVQIPDTTTDCVGEERVLVASTS